jgi:hypothetical protein
LGDEPHPGANQDPQTQTQTPGSEAETVTEHPGGTGSYEKSQEPETVRQRLEHLAQESQEHGQDQGQEDVPPLRMGLLTRRVEAGPQEARHHDNQGILNHGIKKDWGQQGVKYAPQHPTH